MPNAVLKMLPKCLKCRSLHFLSLRDSTSITRRVIYYNKLYYRDNEYLILLPLHKLHLCKEHKKELTPIRREKRIERFLSLGEKRTELKQAEDSLTKAKVGYYLVQIEHRSKKEIEMAKAMVRHYQILVSQRKRRIKELQEVLK